MTYKSYHMMYIKLLANEIYYFHEINNFQFNYKSFIEYLLKSISNK